LAQSKLAAVAVKGSKMNVASRQRLNINRLQTVNFSCAKLKYDWYLQPRNGSYMLMQPTVRR
jgi:hypothetical protein